MSNDEIIEMARGSGMIYRKFQDEFANVHTDGVDLETLKAFAKLVAEREREAIIDLVAMYGGSVDLEAVIRARGEA